MYCVTDLYPGLTQLGSLTQLLPGVDVWILSPLKCFLQLIKLISGEGGSGSPLFPLQRYPRLSLGILVLRTLGLD